jgi:hypothetical protein
MSKLRILLISVAAMCLAAAALVWALPPNEVDTLYFNDADFTNNIGERILFCDGSHYNWGITASQHRAFLSTPCGSGSPSVLCYVNGTQSSCPPALCSYGGQWCN